MKDSLRSDMKQYRCFIIALFLLISSPLISPAQGNLLITPKRVVFDGTKKYEEINLANIGTDTVTYLISWIQIKMEDNGQLTQISDDQSDSSQKFSDKNIRFFPRRVTLGPHEAQSVKLQLVKKNELSDGEYRSHLFFRALTENVRGDDPPESKDSTVSIRMTPVFGISIPAIIRVGAGNLKTSISKPSLHFGKDSVPQLNLTLNRSGNISCYGNINVDHISANGKVTRVGLLKGLAIYTPNTQRPFSMALDKNPAVDYTRGKLRFVYFDQSDVPVKLAEGELVL